MATATLPADKRVKILDATIRKQQSRPDGLIAVLHKAQELYGYLDKPVLWHVARALHLPASRVYGVATFYHLFRLKPRGNHTCVVCLGTACFVKGAQKLVDCVQERYQIAAGGTTEDQQLSLAVARCIGACGIAPAVILDDNCMGKVTPSELLQAVKERIDGP